MKLSNIKEELCVLGHSDLIIALNDFDEDVKSKLEEFIKDYKLTKDVNDEYNSNTNVTVLQSVIDKNTGKMILSFNTVKGQFNISSSSKLKSLDGVPKKVGESFNCMYNKNLSTMKFSPKIVKGNFVCERNNLEFLETETEKVGGYFWCSYNKLSDLIGSPKFVGSSFACDNNQLVSLKGCTKKINGFFFCYNNKLTNLLGGPDYVDGNFDCSGNDLESLDGAPKKVIGYFNCRNNKVKFTEDDVRKVCDVKGNIIV